MSAGAGSRRGQVSTELLVIVGFIVLLFIPLMVMIYFKSAQLNSDLGDIQSRLLVSKIAFAANSIGSMGSDNALKLEIYLPNSVKTLEFRSEGSGGEVLINSTDGSQISQVTKFPFNAPQSYPGGVGYKFEMSSDHGIITVAKSD